MVQCIVPQLPSSFLGDVSLSMANNGQDYGSMSDALTVTAELAPSVKTSWFQQAVSLRVV